MMTEIQIMPLTGLAFGFMYYDSSQEDDYDEQEDVYFEHYTILLLLIAVRIVRF